MGETRFYELSDEDAQIALADAIVAASCVTMPDPISAWDEHNKLLRERTNWLNTQNFAALHFYGDGTDLMVGLAQDHEWMGGASVARNGVTCNANIPTEEVFTTPHASNVNGHVKSTKPLSHQGTLIEDTSVTFKDGVITDASASKGEEVLLKLLDTDEDARRLGEVALVPHGSPISQSDILFTTHCLMEMRPVILRLDIVIPNVSRMDQSYRKKKLLHAAGIAA